MSTTHKVTLTPAEQFFYDNAGYSFDPATETATSGRTRVALALADAEKALNGGPLTVTWQEDPEPDESGTDDGQPYIAVLHGPDERCNDLPDDDGPELTSCGGVTFGPGRDPWSNPVLARVVAANLVSEYLTSGHY